MDLREKEKQAYLARLRGRADVREQTKQLRKQNEAQRAQEAVEHATRFLYRLDERSQVRVNVREKMVNDTAHHHEVMAQLGEIYKGRLQGRQNLFIQRDLSTHETSLKTIDDSNE